MKNQSKDSKNSTEALLLVALLLGGAFLLIDYSNKKKGVAKQTKKISTMDLSSTLVKNRPKVDLEAEVNQALQEVERQRSLRKDKMEVENYYLAPEIGQTITQKMLVLDRTKDELEQENPFESEVFDRNPSKRNESIESEIQEKVQRRREQEEMRNAYLEAYKKSYIEMARKNGFEVEVGDDMKVTSVRKIDNKVLGNKNGK